MKEPIAIIGIGCRFPGGANSPEILWQLLCNGVDAISPMPPGRFEIEHYYSPVPGARGKIVTNEGGFIEHVDGFDAAFFGISDYEARNMDPQQRLLLEITWEALEDAGQSPGKLRGTKTAVFVGMWTNDYEDNMYAASEDIDLYMTTGTGRYSASGRLSYMFDFRGPSITVDTACSSSLVALLLACQSLWNGESELAVAGGVNLILAPQISIGYSRSGMLSPDARCKFGDARANGYVRSEGAGVVLVKPLGQALADGDPIYALVRGGAVNNDGYSGGVLVAPSPDTQATMLREAYHSAGVDPGLVGYVEAHGTGTRVGDPVELRALGQVFSEGRAAGQSCAIGSVKTNIGHTEAASGIAGVIKAALCLKHRMIPPSLHFVEPNPNIPWDQLPFVMQQSLGPWPDSCQTAFAGVNSFGVTGTNAHLVLEAAPAAAWTGISADSQQPETSPLPLLLPLSARSSEALVQLAQAYAELIPQANLYDLCYTAGTGRAHHPARLALVTQDKQEMQQQIDLFLQGKKQRGAALSSKLDPAPRKVAFIFPGQGGQWLGMGRQLLEQEPVFRQALEACDAALRPYVDWSLLDILQSGEALEAIDQVQPALFALQVALAALWRSWGVEPDGIIGHSMGEIAGAYVAGFLSLEAAAQIICRRSQLMKRVSGQGAMGLVELSFDEAQAAIAGYEAKLGIAVNNGPRSTVIAGDPAALEDVLNRLRDQGVFCRNVKVDVAAHSPHMEALRPLLVQDLGSMDAQDGPVPVYSTVTGALKSGAEFRAAYWGENLRQPVRFAEAVQQAMQDGYNTFIEISPHPVLLMAVEQGIQAAAPDEFVTLASLRREEDERFVMLESLGKLYAAGYDVDWQRLYPNGRALRLPTYPWQKEHFWIDTQEGKGWTASGGHPLIGQRLPALAHLPGGHFWENRLDSRFRRHQHEHFGDGSNEDVFAGIALAAATASFGEHNHRILELSVQEPVALDEGEAEAIQIILTQEGDDIASVQIFCRRHDDSPWTSSANGRIRLAAFEADWLYEHFWQPQPRQSAEPAASPGHWLIFADGQGLGSQLADLLYERGGSATFVLPGDEYARTGEQSYTVNPDRAEDFQQLLAATASDAPVLLYLWALDRLAEFPADAADVAALHSFYGSATLHLTQALAAYGDGAPCLWAVTRAAHSVIDDDASMNPAQTPLWAFGRIVSLELPDLWGGLIDLPAEVDLAYDAMTLFGEVVDAEGEDQIAFRAGERYVLRLRQAAALEEPKLPLPVQAEGTYLITGGRGRLGLVFARWLAEKGARHLVLVGRSDADEAARSAIAELEAAGVQVVAARADIANFDDVQRLFDEISQTMPPLRGIIQAAAVIDAGMIVQQNTQRFAPVLAPKIAGTWNLHRLTQDIDLDFFVMCASIASAMGLAAESSYAIGNAFQEGLAHYRRQRGLAALTISWGTWGEIELDPEFERFVSLLGMRLMPIKPALAALEYEMQSAAVHRIVAAIDWDIFRQMHETRRGRPLFEQLVTRARMHESGKASLAQVLREAPGDQRWRLLLNHVRAEAADILGLDPSMMDLNHGFFRIGMDSLMSVQLRNRLEASLDCMLPPTVALEYPTVATLAEFIATEIFMWTEADTIVDDVQDESEPEIEPGFDSISEDELLALLEDELAKIDDLTEDK